MSEKGKSLEETPVGELLTPATIENFVLLYEIEGFDKEHTLEAFFQVCFRLGVTTKERNTKSQRENAQRAKVGKKLNEFQEYLGKHPELLSDQDAMRAAMAAYGILPEAVIKAAKLGQERSSQAA